MLTRHPRRRRLSSAYATQLWLFLAPYLLGSLFLVIIPALATLGIAFTRYRGLGPPVWVGFANFRDLWHMPLIRQSLQNTLLFLGLALPLRLLGALILALLLQQPGRLLSLCRGAVYLPTIIPEVAYALIWLWVFNPISGPLNGLLGLLGLPRPAWLTEPGAARLAMVIMAAFQIGEGLVVVLAGLQNIPRALYEAAKVDGAGMAQAFRHVTLPLLTPWLLLLTFRDALVSVQNTFTPTFVMTYGGPYYATTFAPLLVYEIAFDLFEMGLAAAVLLFVYALIGVLTANLLNLIGARAANG